MLEISKERTLLTNLEVIDLLERKRSGPLADFTKLSFSKENLDKMNDVIYKIKDTFPY